MSRILYLHSGHHGKGTGAHGCMDEGEQTILLCDEICKHLKCKFVRSKPQRITKDIINQINQRFGADALICDIHFNAFDGKKEGVEVFISKKASQTAKAIAEDMLINVHTLLNNTCRGIKTDDLTQYGKIAILSDTHSPAILIEPCFCDNRKDVENYRNKFAQLAKTIAGVLDKYCL